jgi:flagellar biosynthesis/type III secretory pathway chaperone
MNAIAVAPGLGHNLREQLETAGRLAELLAQEKTALLENAPPELLESLIATKSVAAERLRQLGLPLQQLGAGKPAQLEAALARLADGGRSLADWQALRTLAAQCQRANQENAALLEARHRQVRDTLRQLRGEAPAQTYGRGGYSGMPLGSQRLGSA